MQEDKFEIFNAQIKTNFTLICAGPSNSGKTTFVIELIKNKEILIDNNIDYILWFYGEKRPESPFLNSLENIEFIQGLPDVFDGYINSTKRGLAIFDDLMAECSKNPLITDFFTKKSHHENISVIFITQNFFHSGKERVNFTKNATYLAIFNSPLDQATPYALAKKLMPQNQKTFIEIYNHAIDKPHGYLFIDGHQKTPKKAMFRTDIFNYYQRVFVPKKN